MPFPRPKTTQELNVTKVERKGLRVYMKAKVVKAKTDWNCVVFVFH